MAVYGLRTFQDFEVRVGGECAFRDTGFVLLVPPSKRIELEANIALQRRLGIGTELLSPEALDELLPGLDPAGVGVAAYEPESGYADPYLTTRSYAAAARRHGATILQDTEVLGVRFDGDRVVGIDTSREPIDAPVVVNSAGPWAARIAAMAGVTLPIDPCRVQVSFLRRPPARAPGHPVVVDFVNAAYFRPETGDLTMAGLVDSSEADSVVDPDRFDDGVDEEFEVELAGRLSRRDPAFADSEITRGYASLYDITPDWHPVIDEVPHGSGLIHCAGFSGHGFKLAPAVGLLVADMIVHDGVAECDPHLFRLSRFAEDDPVTVQYELKILG
jgi:sarcosine oxidase subunit beta